MDDLMRATCAGEYNDEETVMNATCASPSKTPFSYLVNALGETRRHVMYLCPLFNCEVDQVR